MTVKAFLDCGCAIKEDGTRAWCPTCLASNEARPVGLTEDERASIERWGEVKGERAVKDRIEAAMDEAEDKALVALARYKFQEFGYWAGFWVHLNRLGEFRRRNRFAFLVKEARLYIETEQEAVERMAHNPQAFCCRVGKGTLLDISCDRCGNATRPLVSQDGESLCDGCLEGNL